MDPIVKHVINSLNKANTFKTKLPKDIFNLEGMSGVKTRIFYNEISSLPDTVYFEVGSWKGSSLCSSGYGNSAKLYCVENWSMWGGPRDEFQKNTQKFGLNPIVFEEDFNTFDPSQIRDKIMVYLYDGDHSYDAQKLAITKMWDSLADTSIIMVDDWNNELDVKKGTLDGLEEVGAEIVERIEIQYAVDPSHPLYDPQWCIISEQGTKAVHTPIPVAQHEFWNGIGVFIVKKPVTTVHV